MTLKYADRVVETSTTTGTGSINLDGAAVGAQTFVSGVGSGSKVAYFIEDGVSWESGVGTVTAGTPDQLSRDRVIGSSSGGTAINWGAGTRNVFLGASSELLLWLDENGNDTNRMGAGGGTGNAQTVTYSRTIAEYSPRMEVKWISAATNTDDVTLSINGLPAKSYVRRDGSQFPSGALAAAHLRTAFYDEDNDRFVDDSRIEDGLIQLPWTGGDDGGKIDFIGDGGAYPATVSINRQGNDIHVVDASLVVGGIKQFNADGSRAFSVGMRNRLINPSGAVYQRSVAATADDAYFADRWYMLTQTGTVTPSRLTNPENGHRNGVRITQSQATAQRFGFAQIIEAANCVDMRGSAVVFQPRIRASASQAICYAILEWTGTEDVVTSDVVANWASGTYTAGNFFLASNLNVLAVGEITPAANTWESLDAITATAGNSLNNMIIMVWTKGTAAQNFTLDFDDNILNKGAALIDAEPLPYGQELYLCYRYFELIYVIFYSGNTGVPVFWRATKRGTPTINSFPSSGSGGVFTAIGDSSAYQSVVNSTFIIGYITGDNEL